MSWNDERVESLKAMWAEGLSASQIAKNLGGVTRNAVIGKVHRLGLSNRAVAQKKTAPKAEAPKAAKPEVKAAEARPDPKPAPAAAPATASRPPQPIIPPASAEQRALAVDVAEVEKNCRRISLLELNERTCKWPIGDPTSEDFHFCGMPSTPGKPYCAAHVAVAFQPMSSRRERERARANQARIASSA